MFLYVHVYPTYEYGWRLLWNGMSISWCGIYVCFVMWYDVCFCNTVWCYLYISSNADVNITYIFYPWALLSKCEYFYNVTARNVSLRTCLSNIWIWLAFALEWNVYFVMWYICLFRDVVYMSVFVILCGVIYISRIWLRENKVQGLEPGLIEVQNILLFCVDIDRSFPGSLNSKVIPFCT